MSFAFLIILRSSIVSEEVRFPIELFRWWSWRRCRSQLYCSLLYLEISKLYTPNGKRSNLIAVLVPILSVAPVGTMIVSCPTTILAVIAIRFVFVVLTIMIAVPITMPSVKEKVFHYQHQHHPHHRHSKPIVAMIRQRVNNIPSVNHSYAIVIYVDARDWATKPHSRAKKIFAWIVPIFFPTSMVNNLISAGQRRRTINSTVWK